MAFIVEDEAHAERQGEFPTFQAAVADLKRRAAEPWDSELNRAPCINWQSCSPRYEIIEQDVDGREIARVPVLKMSVNGPQWLIVP